MPKGALIPSKDLLEWEVKSDKKTNEMVAELLDVSLNSLLAKIGEWHTLFTLMINEVETHEETLAEENKDETEDDGMNLEDEDLEKLLEKVKQLMKNLKVASKNYDEHGHYKDKPESFFKM
eukprot:2673584-Ditylum_brightwellii.AAC.1